MNFHGLIGATSSQKFGDWSFTNFSRRHSGGGHWDGVSFERKKNIQTSQPLRTSLCQPGLGDVVFGRHSGGGHWDGVSFERKKHPKPRNPCEHLCASLVWVTSFLDDIPGGGHWNGFPGAWDANLAIPANTLCASLAWDVGPASCSFLSKRESEAGSSETTHFARGPCENHPCRYSCLCVSGGTKFRDTGR